MPSSLTSWSSLSPFVPQSSWTLCLVFSSLGLHTICSVWNAFPFLPCLSSPTLIQLKKHDLVETDICKYFILSYGVCCRGMDRLFDTQEDGVNILA